LNYRKIIISIVALCFISASIVSAESISRQIHVWVDGREAGDSSIMIDDELYFSAQLVKAEFQGIITWDDKQKTVNIYKPNVHMVTKDNDSIFGEVNQNTKVTFNVFAQIDSLKVDIASFRVTILDPDGDETLIEERRVGHKDFPERGKQNFWINSKYVAYNFEHKGDYIIRFWMQPVEEKSMQVVSEKVIVSK
jgi:hypothetical protein